MTLVVVRLLGALHLAWCLVLFVALVMTMFVFVILRVTMLVPDVLRRWMMVRGGWWSVLAWANVIVAVVGLLAVAMIVV
jgi:hypothetical protein